MAPIGETGHLRRRLGNNLTLKQRIKASDVGARINRRQDVLRLHSLTWTVPPVRVAVDDAAPYQTTEFGIYRMERSLSCVREFRDGKNHLPVLSSLVSEKVLPFQSLHGRQTLKI